jgi:hypothetical protein
MKQGILVALACLVGSAAVAAEPPAGEKPLSATAGPAVNTGDVKTTAPAATPAKAPAAASASPTTPKAPAATASSPTANRQAQAAASSRPRSNDRIDLDTTVVTGNRELPKVLYIVPWKKADIGELPAQPFNTLLDEVLTPVDRDVFRREVTYYGAVSSGSAPAGSGAANGSTAPGGRPPGSEK